MNILITEQPTGNGYIESLINAYQRAGHHVICGYANFFHSDFVPDVLHVHWSERLFDWHRTNDLSSNVRMEILKCRLAWYKHKKVTIIHTVHNLNPHENSHCHNSYEAFSQIIAASDIIVHHCQKSIQLLQEKHPASRSKNHIVCSHGDYLIHYKDVHKNDAQYTYKIPKNKFVILNFGNQRAYKNDDFIHKVFSKLDIKNKYLLTVGLFSLDTNLSGLSKLRIRLRNTFRTKIPHSDRKYHYRSLSVEEISSVIRSADVIFLAQTSSLNSGIIPLAATFSIPVVFPNIGCFQEASENWLSAAYQAGDYLDAVKALKYISTSTKDDTTRDNSEWLKKNSWDRHANTILSALEIHRKQQLQVLS